MTDTGQLRERWALVVAEMQRGVETADPLLTDESGWITRQMDWEWGWWRGGLQFLAPAEALAMAEERRPPLKERVAAIAASDKKALQEQVLSVASWQPLESWPRPLPPLVLQLIHEQLVGTDI